VTVRGQVLPVIRLHELFSVTPRTTELTAALVVIVEHEGRLAALMVDELLGQQQVVIKSLEHNFKKIEGVAGATILGDGHVALILDVPGLVALARVETVAARPALAEAASA
jgi:two-component system chemotaxis sensor kinase CheA